ncbi:MULTISPECIES: ribbon-helix-helix protein, CopG family [unclassified Cellulomonas]|uniref:ribbon-helix-helix protein, CopG family n=1 Tax=unclassified Cellulomonas TaxID=2620175 RepID=UPI001C4F85DC|nr:MULTISPECIES: ribbon-helix-helix protein, CopG family [unclassified Cellulomonas]MBW0254418.1 ribbon-helix-helix protein, CopG family [Cellulomonas sp. PS-H5]MCG7284646.1 ribbon-helix-helix protein, CopG family [Cellulomonas sp. ACRRI]
MSEYDELADRAQRGEMTSKPGTARRGPSAAEAGRQMLMQATGQNDPDEAVRVALGRPRLGSEGPSPVWKVRASAQLDAQVRAAAAARHVPMSQLVREAVAAYLVKAG